MGVISAKGIPPLKEALKDQNESVRAAAAWSLGQMGGHTPDHAKAMAENNIPRLLLDLYRDPRSSEDLKKKAKKALKSILQMCSHLSALEPLIADCPGEILHYVLHQFAKTLPNDPAAKKSFIQSGGLKKIQEIKSQPGQKLKQYVDEINALYPL